MIPRYVFSVYISWRIHFRKSKKKLKNKKTHTQIVYSVTPWCSTCFVLHMCLFLYGHFVMVPLNLTCRHFYNIFSLNISFIYIQLFIGAAPGPLESVYTSGIKSRGIRISLTNDTAMLIKPQVGVKFELFGCAHSADKTQAGKLKKSRSFL